MVSSFVPGKLYQYKETRLVVFLLATEPPHDGFYDDGPNIDKVWLLYVDGTGRRAWWLVHHDEFDEVLPGI